MKKLVLCAVLLLMANGVFAGGNPNAGLSGFDTLRKEMDDMKTQFKLMMKEINNLKSENKTLKDMLAKAGETPHHGSLSRAELPDGVDIHTVNESGLRISGVATGVFQAAMGNHPQDTTNAEGSFNLIFESDVTEGGMILVNIEAVGNDGPNSVVGSYSGLNGDAGSTGLHVDLLEAWYEQTLFDDRLVFTIGYISPTSYFDGNEVANDETAQFLASAFVNSNVLDLPGNGPGMRATYSIYEWLDISMGIQSGDQDGDFVFDRVCWIGELDFHTQFFGRDGNYRMYLTVNGDRHSNENVDENDESVGFGFSVDQKITDTLAWFGRLGFRDDHLAESGTEWAWSTGFQVDGPLVDRPDDTLGIAVGQTQPNREVNPNLKRTTFDFDENGGTQNDYMAGLETLMEVYYSIPISDKFTVTPNILAVFNPSGDINEDCVIVTGFRGNFEF